MSDPIKQLMKDMLDVKRRLARLEAADSFANESWTAWTPTLVGSTTAGTYTYSTRAGLYLRIDDLVFVQCSIAISGITVAGTGNARITGLPYTSTADNTTVMATSANVNLTAGYSRLTAFISTTDLFMGLFEEGDDVRQVYGVAGIAVNDAINASGFYRATV